MHISYCIFTVLLVKSFNVLACVRFHGFCMVMNAVGEGYAWISLTILYAIFNATHALHLLPCYFTHQECICTMHVFIMFFILLILYKLLSYYIRSILLQFVLFLFDIIFIVIFRHKWVFQHSMSKWGYLYWRNSTSTAVSVPLDGQEPTVKSVSTFTYLNEKWSFKSLEYSISNF